MCAGGVKERERREGRELLEGGWRGARGGAGACESGEVAPEGRRSELRAGSVHPVRGGGGGGFVPGRAPEGATTLGASVPQTPLAAAWAPGR